MKTILVRLQERTTWAGIALLLPAVGIQLSPETWNATINVVQAVIALVLIIWPERPRP